MSATVTTETSGVVAPAGVKPEARILGTVKAGGGKGASAIALMNAPAMEQLFFVSTYSSTDPDSPAPQHHGYQRDPMKERLKGIAEYFLRDEARFTPLVVSVRLEDPNELIEFERLFNAGKFEEIHQRWNESVVSIVDGQHRFKGLVLAQEMDPTFNPSVPVLLLYGLSYIEEAKIFDVINTTQRKLPKALIETTKGDIVHTGEKNHAQIVREIAFALARDEDSPWFNQINMTGARDPERPVTYEGLRRSTANMFTSALIRRLEAKQRDPIAVAKRYWDLVADACRPAWEGHEIDVFDEEVGEYVSQEIDYRIKDLVGVAALAKLGNDILTSALEHDNMDQRMVDMVSKLSEVDWVKGSGNPWMAGQAGFAGQKDLYEILYNLVYLDQRPGEDHR